MVKTHFVDIFQAYRLDSMSINMHLRYFPHSFLMVLTLSLHWPSNNQPDHLNMSICWDIIDFIHIHYWCHNFDSHPVWNQWMSLCSELLIIGIQNKDSFGFLHRSYWSWLRTEELILYHIWEVWGYALWFGMMEDFLRGST